jgi:HEPN domain-containing protein
MNINELVVSEWISSALEDFGSATVLAKVPYYAPACYHCQQSVEKILKAYIIAKENILIKTHDLEDLINKCEKHTPDFGKFKDACEDLTLYTTIRYPPFGNLTEQDMLLALKDAQKILEFTKSKLAEMGFGFAEINKLGLRETSPQDSREDTAGGIHNIHHTT